MAHDLNPEMVRLAREFRGLTQDALAAKAGIGRVRLAKIEGAFERGDDECARTLAVALGVPESFLRQNERLVGYGSSSLYYRKKADLKAADRRRVHSLVNLLRISSRSLLDQVDIEPQRKLPRLAIEEYGDPASVAKALRSYWTMADGPISSVTEVLEGAGILVFQCPFGTRSMDATSLWLADLPPMIFINADLPGDRYRFTLCHELGHLVMHEIPHAAMEDEADGFAAEFLMPAASLRPEFARMGTRITIERLARLKPYWKVSIAALLKRARDLGYLTAEKAQYLWRAMSKLGYRSKDGQGEPLPIEREEPRNMRMLIDAVAGHLSMAEFAQMIRLSPEDVRSIFVSLPWAEESPARLRLVAG